MSLDGVNQTSHKGELKAEVQYLHALVCEILPKSSC